MPQCDTTGTGQADRCSDFITCAPGAALPTRITASAPASRSRCSCGVMSTSLSSNFSAPASLMPAACAAAVRPPRLDSPQPLLTSISPGVLEPKFVIACLIKRAIDQHVDGRDAEDVVRVGTVAGDVGGGRPHAHERNTGRVHQRHDRLRDRAVDAAEQDDAALLVDQFACRGLALAGVRLVVATDQLDHAPAEHAAARIDLVDRDGEAAGDAFARFRGLAGQRRDQPDLDGIGGARDAAREAPTAQVRQEWRAPDGASDGSACQHLPDLLFDVARPGNRSGLIIWKIDVADRIAQANSSKLRATLGKECCISKDLRAPEGLVQCRLTRIVSRAKPPWSARHQ